MKYTFPKERRVIKRSDFQQLAKFGVRHTAKYLSARSLPASFPTLGITVTRKFGKAHLRNRFKRLVREAFRQMELPPLQIGIYPQPEAKQATLENIKEDLRQLFCK